MIFCVLKRETLWFMVLNAIHPTHATMLVLEFIIVYRFESAECPHRLLNDLMFMRTWKSLTGFDDLPLEKEFEQAANRWPAHSLTLRPHRIWSLRLVRRPHCTLHIVHCTMHMET